jgi:hypothetical protein
MKFFFSQRQEICWRNACVCKAASWITRWVGAGITYTLVLLQMISAEGLDVGKTISNGVWAPRSGMESFRCDVQYGEDGKRLEMSHLGTNSTWRTSEEQRCTRSFLELPTRPIRGTALQPRASRIPGLIYGEGFCNKITGEFGP